MHHASSDLSFPLEQFQHLPNPYYPHDALRDSLVRTNIVNLDLASPPPPQRTNPRSHPLTPPDTPGHRRINRIHVDLDDQIDRGQKQAHLDAFLTSGLLVNKNNHATRYLVVGGVPSLTPTNLLSQVFCRMGALKGMFVRYQDKGVVVLSWHDLRDAKKAHTFITTNTLFDLEEPLSAAFITPLNLVKSAGESLFVNPKEGNIAITAEQPVNSMNNASDSEDEQKQQPISLHAALALFGELSSFSATESIGSTTYFASYYDAREAANAAKSLHNRSILGMRIRVVEGFPQDSMEPQKDKTSALQIQSPAATPDKRTSKNKTEPLSPSSLRRTQSTISSDSEASTPRTPAQAQAPRTQAQDDSPISQLPQTLPPSANLHIRPNPNSKAFSKDGAKVSVSVNIPLYSTPPRVSPRARTMSSGPLTIQESPNSLSPQHMLPRTFPPRLSLPWLHAPGSGSPLQYEAVGGPGQFNPGRPTHYPQGAPALGPGAYIHGLDTTPQPAHHGPYTYHPPQNFSPRSFAGNSAAGNDTSNGESPTVQIHSSPHGHTLSTSTSTSISTSTGTAPSTIDSAHSGPSTPLHAYGRSPALSSKSSFDLGHGRGHQAGVGFVPRDKRRGEVKEPASEVIDMADAALQPRLPREGQYTGGYAAPERNGVDVGRIEAGLDTRTTVMLKNIPNKMSDADLRKYISDVVPNAFDFVYLRFDFNSSANVGYAFVNFVEVADLLAFAKAKLGVKWNMFCSEKVLQMSYANFQGKEALVEKFKNSCVMEMQDDWVPKIFYSSGANKGQREPFPPATNPSRARRSQDQRERGLLRGAGLFIGGGRGHFGFKHGH